MGGAIRDLSEESWRRGELPNTVRFITDKKIAPSLMSTSAKRYDIAYAPLGTSLSWASIATDGKRPSHPRRSLCAYEYS